MLAILTIGAVSASQDLSDDNLTQESSDDLAVEEITTDELSQSPSDDEEVLKQTDDDEISMTVDENESEPLGAKVNSEEVLGDYYTSKIHIRIYDTVDLSTSYYDLGYIEDSNGIKGTVSVSIDGKKVFSKKFTSGSKYFYSIGNDVINLKKYGFGYHSVKITYNTGKARTDSRKVNFVSVPDVISPYIMSVGEANGIIIRGNSKMSGTATLYIRDEVGSDKYNNTIYKKGNAISTVKISNGYAFIPLKKLNAGSLSFQLDYKIGTYKSSEIIDIRVENNSPGFKSSISKTSIYDGKSVTIKMTGPRNSEYVSIYVDGKYLKDVRFNSGSLKESISGLSVGTHYISINLDPYGSNVFYSNTFKVVVKSNAKLTLKKVVVKKSAKKLVITASLKIKNKVAKNKKLTFKFNKKTYTAKTNKKGIAKITVKKTTLKKLKVGKKLTYQVSYGKNTVKQTVVVKK